MNHLIIIFIVGLGTVQVSAKGIESFLDLMPESSKFPTDNQELAQLPAENKEFSGFCLAIRDYVSNELRGKPINLATKLVKYGQGMSPGSRFLLNRATEKLFGQLEKPDTTIEGLYSNYPYDQIIWNGMEKIKQSKSYSESYMIALTYIWLAYSSYSKDEINNKLKEAESKAEVEEIYKYLENDRSKMAEYISDIRDQFYESKSAPSSKDSSVVGAELRDTDQDCSNFDRYQTEIRKQFDDYKSKVASRDESIVGVGLDNLGCLTTKRVMNAVAVCNFMETAKRPIMHVLREESL